MSIEQRTVRVQSLEGFRAHLRSLDLASDPAFHKAFCEAQSLLELTDAELADKLLVSRPTVNRWVRGRNLPRPALRKPIVDWIDEQIAQRIRIAKKASSSGGGQSWSSTVAIAAKSG